MRSSAICFVACLHLATPVIAQPTASPQVSVPVARLANDQLGQAVDTLAATLDARYVDPDGGARMAKAIRARLTAGDYATLSDPVELAARLSADLQAIVPDVHLRVAYEPTRSAETLVRRPVARQASAATAAGPQPFARIDPRSADAIARTNFGFDAVRRLDGNIGYLKISQFVPPEMSAATAKAAMDFLANSDAMIIDLRGNIGGSPELVRLLLSYFAGPEPMTLMTRYSREGNLTETMTTLGTVPGRTRAGTPLHILIDRNTASAAEMFSYLAQQKKLGVVYGQISSGAGQGGNMIPIGSGLAAFVPFTRIIDGPGWEGSGVRPDVAIGRGDALNAAHAAALKQLLARDGEDQVKRDRAWALELVEASDRPQVTQEDLARFAGRFGSRNFEVRDGLLHVVGATGRVDPLIRISQNVFRTPNGRYTFGGPESGMAATVMVEALNGTRSDAVRST